MVSLLGTVKEFTVTPSSPGLTGELVVQLDCPAEARGIVKRHNTINRAPFFWETMAIPHDGDIRVMNNLEQKVPLCMK
jgi:hypothetical protein